MIEPEEDSLTKEKNKYKNSILKDQKNILLNSKQFGTGKTIESKAGFDIDYSKVQDLMNEEDMVDEIDPEDLLIDTIEDEDQDKKKRSKSVQQQKKEDKLATE